MGLKSLSEMGNVKCANRVGLMAQGDLWLSASKYREIPGKRSKNGCYEVEYTRNGRGPSEIAGTVSTS
jgi:hypothetical protein